MSEITIEPYHVHTCLAFVVAGCVVAYWKQRQHQLSGGNGGNSNASARRDEEEGVGGDGERLTGSFTAPGTPNTSVSSGALPSEFAKFQRSYLVPYLLCTFSDWLKGPYVYALYEEYGFSKLQIAWLFVGGFLSSLVFGTLVGSLSDKYGRRRMCLVFCVVYAASAFTKLVNSFAVLFFGRVLSGVATSLLFTSFESWMVAEHRARHFPDAWLANTFSKAILGNGLAAIGAGFVAQLAADCCGYVAPFLVAVPCLTVAGWFFIRHWGENYGNQSVSLVETLQRGFDAVARDRAMQLLGSCQALFEACMYTWVFYWTMCLRTSTQSIHNDTVPFGLVFAAYMGALMIGGTLTDLVPLHQLVQSMHLSAIACMAIAALLYYNKVVVLLMFVAFEGLVGVYFGAHGMLRSLHIEESCRSAVMNVFRVPLNFLVVALLQLPLSPQAVMVLLMMMHIMSFICYKLFHIVVSGKAQ